MPNQLTDHVTLRHGTTLNNRIVMSPMQTHSGLKGGFALMILFNITLPVHKRQVC